MHDKLINLINLRVIISFKQRAVNRAKLCETLLQNPFQARSVHLFEQDSVRVAHDIRSLLR